MIKNIIFDWGGVLSVSNHNEPIRRFEKLGLEGAEKYFDEGKNWNGIFGSIEDGSISQDDFLMQLSAMCRHSISFEDVAYAWWGFYNGLTEGLIPNLVEWRKKYRLVVLTNNNPFMMSVIRSESFTACGKPFCSYFDSVYASCDLKMAKPSPYIYNRVMELEHILPSESVMIDDRMSNLEGAAAAGLKIFHAESQPQWISKFNEYLKAEP